MKILLVNYEYKPQCGGAGLGIYNMAYTLKKMGYEVSLLIGWDYTYGSPEIIDDVDTYIVKTKKKNIHQSTARGLLKFVIKGLFLIKKITKEKRYDIIQFYFSVPTGILKFGIDGNVPYVISLRGMDVPGFRKDKYRFLSEITRCINKLVIKDAAAVTSLSGEVGKIFNEFSPETKIVVIPNAVDYEQYKPKEYYRKEISKFVSVSRLTGFKNLDLLIKAFAKAHERYPNITLDIYGEGRERKNLENLITELHAGEYVVLKGYADRKTLIDVLPQYDVFSLMSIGDSFGIVFIEAMAAGLPILCAKAGGPVEIVLEGKTGLFARPNDLDDTVNILEYSIRNPILMEKFGKNGRQRVVEQYSRESIANQHIELYKKCMER